MLSPVQHADNVNYERRLTSYGNRPAADPLCDPTGQSFPTCCYANSSGARRDVVAFGLDVAASKVWISPASNATADGLHATRASVAWPGNHSIAMGAPPRLIAASTARIALHLTVLLTTPTTATAISMNASQAFAAEIVEVDRIPGGVVVVVGGAAFDRVDLEETAKEG